MVYLLLYPKSPVSSRPLLWPSYSSSSMFSIVMLHGASKINLRTVNFAMRVMWDMLLKQKCFYDGP